MLRLENSKRRNNKYPNNNIPDFDLETTWAS